MIIEMNTLILMGFLRIVIFKNAFSLTAPAVTLLKTAVIAVTRPVIIQPDKRSPAPGPADLTIEREVLPRQRIVTPPPSFSVTVAA